MRMMGKEKIREEDGRRRSNEEWTWEEEEETAGRKETFQLVKKQRDWTTKRSFNADKETTIFITTAEGKAVPTSTAAQEKGPQHRNVTQGNKPQSRPFNSQHARPFTKPHLELKRN